MSIDEFNKLRKRDINILSLVTSLDNEEKSLYFYHERSALNTLSKDLAEIRENKYKEIKKVKGQTLNTIIENTKYRNAKIDLLSIDIENYEYEALKNFNFKKYGINVIVAETTDTTIKDLETYNLSLDKILNSKLYQLLIANGYKLINWVNSDLIFIKKNKFCYLDNKPESQFQKVSYNDYLREILLKDWFLTLYHLIKLMIYHVIL